uniref:Rab-GAP TBC domain-containing protein n=1 Tax=Plectus sambesii TaxID=2011161 RepID=A0A914W7I3_9BILA
LSVVDDADIAETRQSRYYQNEIRNWLNRHQPGMDTFDIHSQGDLSTYTCPELLSKSNNSAQSSQQSSLVGDRIESNLQLTEEVRQFREKEHGYQQELQRLNQKNQRLIVEIEQLKQLSQNRDQVLDKNYLLTRNRFLNSEVVRLSSKWQDEQSQYVQLSRRVIDLEAQLDQFKQQYVYLLQSCIRIPVCERHSVELVEVKLFGGDVHKKRVCQLLDEARRIDPTLPTFDSLTSGNSHVDLYGFRHSYAEESLALHYICTQLHQHYQSQLTAQQQHRHRWKLYLAQSKNIFINNKETRALVRNGIPSAYRSTVWRCLIHQQVVDYKVKYGKYYYRNLCSSQGSADVEFSTVHQKQIMLDLLRTMPNNVHFSSPTCKGVNQLQTVLRAYCLHNSTIGYCQGMNFIAGTCLLFLSPEDTFWFLVALTEKYFVSSYFDNSLTGAQADQEVLKDLVAHMLPGLAEHLEKCDIDLATVTLNWFLALFFDAVPFQLNPIAFNAIKPYQTEVEIAVQIGLLAISEPPP